MCFYIKAISNKINNNKKQIFLFTKLSFDGWLRIANSKDNSVLATE
ncbi:MAG: hypothetical protein IGBAC_0933 [Ignavibacteriae bacterium]|nr:MAG: hypothetical protein IGBAC_0933 [Ignavibacteriota bacterium]